MANPYRQMLVMRGAEEVEIHSGDSDRSYTYLTWNGNTLSWYCNKSNAMKQLNESGCVFSYLALG